VALHILQRALCVVVVYTLEPSFVRCVLCTAMASSSSSSLVSKERAAGSSDTAPLFCILSFFLLYFVCVPEIRWTRNFISPSLHEMQLGSSSSGNCIPVQLYSMPCSALPCDIDVVVFLFSLPHFLFLDLSVFLFSFLILFFFLRLLLRTHRHIQTDSRAQAQSWIHPTRILLLCAVLPCPAECRLELPPLLWPFLLLFGFLLARVCVCVKIYTNEFIPGCCLCACV